MLKEDYLFNAPDQVVILSGPYRGKHAEIVSRLPELTYMVKFNDQANLSTVWRFMNVGEDDLDLVEDYNYSYTTPDEGESNVAHPYQYMKDRMQEKRLYNGILGEGYHADWDSRNPDVVAAIKNAAESESNDLLAAFERDVILAYGFTGTLEPFGRRLIRLSQKILRNNNINIYRLDIIDQLSLLIRDYVLTLPNGTTDPLPASENVFVG